MKRFGNKVRRHLSGFQLPFPVQQEGFVLFHSDQDQQMGTLEKVYEKLFDFRGLLMVSYELCLALSFGYSQNSKQAIEIGMVNYLWPSFRMIVTVVLHLAWLLKRASSETKVKPIFLN